MTKLRSYLRALRLLSKLAFSCFALCAVAQAQILNQHTQVEVRDLPSSMARSSDPMDLLLTSLDTVFHDREVCCGKDSALEDSAQGADPNSLKDVASKLQGRHLLSDGRPIMVTAEYLAPEAINSGHLITMIKNQHAALMEWNFHLYVVHGVVYIWNWAGGDEGGRPQTEIHKFLLWDTRYSDARRNVVFDRTIDDPKNVQGLLFLEAKPQ